MSPKKRKRKQTSKSGQHRQSSKDSGFRIGALPSPFKGMTQAEADDLFIKIGREFGNSFDEAFTGLQNQLLTLDPLLLLSIFSFYNHFQTGDRVPKPAEQHRILQQHLELLQGLILRNKYEAFKFEFPTPPRITQVRELVYTADQAFFMRRYATLDPSMSKEQRHRLRVMEEVRGHTQGIRNWGYPQQIMRIVAELFAPLDDEIEKQKGVRIEHLITMYRGLTKVLEERINSHLKELRPVFTAKSLSAIVENYYKILPKTDSEPEKLLKLFKDRGAKLNEAKAMILSHSDLRLPEKFMFTFDDFVDAYPKSVDRDSLQKVIDGWTLSFGDLAATDPEHLFMGNPIWARPIIRLDENVYFMPIVGLLISFCLEQMEKVIDGNVELKAKYEVSRAKFLENEVERIFKRALPSASIYRGSLWLDPDSGKEFENDLMILIDSYLFIVEAKSGKFSASAQRGSELRLQRAINSLMIEPALQAKRFTDYLQKNPGHHRFSTRRGVVNQVDTSQIHEIFRINVTLDELANVHASWTDLQRAGFIPSDADLGPTMSLPDLEIVFEVLDSACEKIHYLVRRTQFEINAIYYADETDLLAFYLENGFSIGETEFDGSVLILSGLSERLDPYFMREWRGQNVRKPQRRYTKWWKRIIKHLEGLLVPRWTEFCYMLLSLTYEEQQWFEREFWKIRRNVEANWQVPNHLNAFVLFSGPPQRRTAIVGVAYKRVSREVRNQMMKNAAGSILEDQPMEKALVIGIDVEKQDPSLPYHVMAWVYKDKATNP
ncbi:MAG TPA: hypothetical protein VGC87_09810 [Pyrinomonadaceae bacterium]|jgi:hypothetical protein